MKKRLLILILLLFAISSLGFAARAKTRFEKKYEIAKYPAELDLKGVPLSDALSLLSRSTKISVVASSNISNLSIDLYLPRNQRLKKILETIKNTHGLTSAIINDTIILKKAIIGIGPGPGPGDLKGQVVGKVVGIDKITGIRGVTLSLGDDVTTLVLSDVGGTFIINDVDPGTYILKATLRNYKPTGELVEVKVGGKTSVTVVLAPDTNGRVFKTIQKDREDTGKVVEPNGDIIDTRKILLRHGLPSEIEKVISPIVNLKKIIAVDKQNVMILKGTEENIKTAERLIERMDTPVKQVRITARVIDTKDNLLEELGVNWSGERSLPASLDAGAGSNYGNAGFNGSKFSLSLTGFLGSATDVVKASIDMLKTTDYTNITAVPSIVTLNGESAEIKVSEEVIIGITTTTDDDGNVTEKPLLEEAGTLFKVTPIIRDGENEKDTILLTIQAEVSEFSDVSTYNSSVGAKQNNNTMTKVRVTDGGTMFIGGLKKTKRTKSVQKIPLLGSIPVIGALFRKTHENIVVRDIYIEIKAEIVTEKNINTKVRFDDYDDEVMEILKKTKEKKTNKKSTKKTNKNQVKIFLRQAIKLACLF